MFPLGGDDTDTGTETVRIQTKQRQNGKEKTEGILLDRM